MPYRDLVEQKGPYIYLLYGLGALLSETSYHGVFVVEAISATMLWYWVYKTQRLFIGKDTALFCVPLCAYAFYTSPAYIAGSAEELLLPCLGFTLYSLCKLFDEPTIYASGKEWLVNGVLASILFWSKFNLCGFYIAYAATVAFLQWKAKGLRGAVVCLGIFAGGCILASIPVILYFGCNHAFSDLWNIYIIMNLTYYPYIGNINSRIVHLFTLIVHRWMYFRPIFIGSVACLIGLLLSVREWRFHFPVILLFMGFGYIGIYWGGLDFDYYYFPFALFIPLSLAVWVHVLHRVTLYLKKRKALRVVPAVSNHIKRFACILCAGVLLVNVWQLNKWEIRNQGTPSAVETVGQIIAENSSETLLNYGSLDIGVYMTSGILPSEKYFCRLNLYSTEMNREQDRYIVEGTVEYVVAPVNIPLPVNTHYTLQSVVGDIALYRK
ncbi:hypothetical protein AGMMS49992_25590 [Clostridia bacterium]|nr:hypothetical protein AGMMS49992_25590 [Clostridia bacterium]